MSDDPKKAVEYQQAFRQIAEAVRQLPPDQQKAIRQQLGEYTHDLKHILGLVTGANALLLRDKEVPARQQDTLKIIGEAAMALNAHFDLLIQNLSSQIGVDD